MKTMFVYILSLGLFVAHPVRGFATPEISIEDAIQSAKALRDTLSQNFYPYVQSVVGTGIQSRFLFLMWDHAGVRQTLYRKAVSGIHNVTQLERKFDDLAANLETHDSEWEARASEAMALVARAQNSKLEAEAIARDAVDLQGSWRTQCGPELRGLTRNLFDPLSVIPVMEVDGVTAAKKNVEIGVTVTTNMDDGSTAVRPASTNPFEKGNEIDAIALNVGVGLIATGNPIAVIVGAVILAVWLIVKLGMFFHEAVERARKEGELTNIRQEIRDVQIAAIQRASSELPSVVEAKCQEAFPQSQVDKLYLVEFNQYQTRAREAYERMAAKREKILTLYADRYESLAKIYFPNVSELYLNLVNEKSANIGRVNDQVSQIIKTVFNPLFQRMKDPQTGQGVGRWQTQQNLWSAIIETDAVYRTRSGFSFYSNGTAAGAATAPQVSGFWNDLGPRFKGVFQ